MIYPEKICQPAIKQTTIEHVCNLHFHGTKTLHTMCIAALYRPERPVSAKRWIAHDALSTAEQGKLSMNKKPSLPLPGRSSALVRKIKEGFFAFYSQKEQPIFVPVIVCNDHHSRMLRCFRFL